MKNTKSQLKIIGSMATFGTIGVIVRNINLTSSVISLVRAFIATAFLILFFVAKKQRLDIKSYQKQLPLLVISGVGIGFNWIVLFEAYRYTTVATATLCYYMEPIILIIASPIFFKEKLNIRKVLCVFVALIGMIPVSGILKSSFSIKESTGVLLGLLAAVMYATVITLNKYLCDVPALDKTVIQLASGGVILLPYVLLTNKEPIVFDAKSVILLVLLGVLHTGIAYTLYFDGIKDVNTQTVAVLSYIDPVVSIILSAVVLHENIGILGYVGAVLILCATFVSETPHFYNKTKSSQ